MSAALVTGWKLDTRRLDRGRAANGNERPHAPAVPGFHRTRSVSGFELSWSRSRPGSAPDSCQVLRHRLEMTRVATAFDAMQWLINNVAHRPGEQLGGHPTQQGLLWLARRAERQLLKLAPSRKSRSPSFACHVSQRNSCGTSEGHYADAAQPRASGLATSACKRCRSPDVAGGRDEDMVARPGHEAACHCSASRHGRLGRHRDRRPPPGALRARLSQRARPPPQRWTGRAHQTVSGSDATIALPGLQL